MKSKKISKSISHEDRLARAVEIVEQKYMPVLVEVLSDALVDETRRRYQRMQKTHGEAQARLLLEFLHQRFAQMAAELRG
jgi:hypothetical protein